MTDIVFRSDFDVTLIDSMGDDKFICNAARVSTQGADSYGTDESKGLLNFLMANRHGTPFEHGTLTYLIAAPIFVWREFHRHRIGFSYNEESGRYKQLDPVFYIPDENRNLIQTGKTGAYNFLPGDKEQYQMMSAGHRDIAKLSYMNYERQLRFGIAKEVARMTLPVNIYSSCYVTCNPRSLMSFLSLRVKDDNSMFKSFPQWEINAVAKQMESRFTYIFPEVHAAFCKNGRVSP